MFKRLLTGIAGACLGLVLAALILGNFYVTGDFKEAAKTLLLAGLILGLLNFFIKPIVKIITLPINVITLGLFGLIINILIIWVIDIVFTPEITIKGLLALFLTSLFVSVVNAAIAPLKNE